MIRTGPLTSQPEPARGAGATSSDFSPGTRCLLPRDGQVLARFTDYPDYHVYVWNNRLGAPELEAWLLAQPRLTLLSAAAYEQLQHPHRTPLQRLYHLAREEGAKYIVTLDSDAHPLNPGWLTTLLAKLNEGAVVAGIWYDLMTSVIRPYVHPSCLCTTVDFVERYRLRFDFDNTLAQEKSDTLSHFTWLAEASGLPIYRLLRTNRRQYHGWMGGIYGDLIYHHAAVTRTRVFLQTNLQRANVQSDHIQHLRDSAADLLFNNYAAYIGWLQGKDVDSLVGATLSGLDAQERQRNQALSLSQAGLAPVRTARLALSQRIKRRIRIVLQGSRWGRWALAVRRSLIHPPRKLAPPGERAEYRPHFMPFQREQLAPLPPHGWTAGAPDFVGVGAPKCGTTWWYQLMLEHPQLIGNRVRRAQGNVKETEYFPHFQYRAVPTEALTLYCEAFAAPPRGVCGEFSTQYLGYPSCLEHLAVAAPRTKILVILRNPIDRFISHVNHLTTKSGRRYFANLAPSADYLLHNYSFYTEAVLHSLYSIGLARLFRYFDREQVLVLQFERLVRFPEQELARTYRFLGVDDRWRVRDHYAPVNSGTYVIAKPDADERRRLAAYFEDDVQRAFALCPELDPALWPDFSVRRC